MNKNIKKILKKEIRETLRDRKSLLMMIVIPLLIPLVIIGFSAFFDASINKDVVEYNKIGFNYQLSEEEMLIIEKLTIEPIIMEDETDLKKAYEDDKIDLYITKKENNYILNGVSNETTAYASNLAKAYFEVYKQYLQMEYLENNGISSEDVINIITLEENIIEEENFYVTYMLSYAFTFIIMAITVASTYPSTDTTAGEKERGTLETLLTFPISSKDIIVGKFLSVSTSAITTGLISLVLALVSFKISNSLFEMYKTAKLTLSALGILYSVVVIIAYSFLISGLCIAISSKAKTFKEAQSSLTPFTFLAVFPGLIVTMVELESSVLTSLIPFLNFSLLFNDISSGNVNLLYIILMLISTITIIMIVFKVIVKQYKSEKILF